MQRCIVLAHVDPEMEADMDILLTAAFEREIKYLDPSLKRFSDAGKTAGLQPVGPVVAALGAAERMM
jgi:hypothetical protein